MRSLYRLVLAACVAAATTPTFAQSLIDEIKAARDLFTFGLDRPGMLDGSYFDQLSAGIEGEWAIVTPILEDLADTTKFEETLSATCDRYTTTIAVSEPLALSFSRGPEDARYTATYVYAAGATFSGQVDPKAFLTFLGVPEDRRESALLALGSATSDVQMYRPAPDVLILSRVRGPADIYARCGSGASSPVGAVSALGNALGAVFDREFPSSDPGVRATFIACAEEAFSPFSPKDIAIAIEHEFDPPQKERERIEATYPGMEEALIACAEAAEAAKP